MSQSEITRLNGLLGQAAKTPSSSMPPAKTAETAEDWLAKEIQKQGEHIMPMNLTAPNNYSLPVPCNPSSEISRTLASCLVSLTSCIVAEILFSLRHSSYRTFQGTQR